MFDASSYLATLEPPVYVDRAGRKHVGRILGADQWLAFQQSLRDTKGIDPVLRRIVTNIFPHPWWKIWQRSVARDIWQLPPIGRMRAVWDFMQSQAKAMGVSFPGTFPQLPVPPDSPADQSLGSPTPGLSPSSTSDIPASITSGAVAGAPLTERSLIVSS